MLTRERVMELLNYDAESGVFTWKEFRGRTARIGSVAGTISSCGHRLIRVDGTKYLAGRLAWLVVHGYFPPQLIDHIDRVKDNNALSNLRLANSSQNAANGPIRVNNKAGFRGVSDHYGKWRATIRVNGKKVSLGSFTTKEMASEAYKSAAIKYYGEFASW